jgi:copper(I)-binding protein
VPPPAVIPTVGINVSAADHSVALNNLFVPAPGGAAYQAGGPAPLSMSVWNNTSADISLTGATVDSHPLELVGGASATATVFTITVPAGGNVPLDQTSGRYLRISCLARPLPAGSLVRVTFTFSNKATIRTEVPVGPYSPGGGGVVSAAAC